LETLIKTLTGENGELYAVTEGRRIRIANCLPKIKIYEKSQNVKALGTQRYKLKSIHIGIVICASRETTRDISLEFLQTVSRFELIGDFQKEDGIFERIKFDNITPNEMNLDDDWEFEVIGQNDTIQKIRHF